MSTKIQWANDRLTYAEATGTVPYSVWRVAEGYKSHDELYNDMVSAGKTEEEIDDVEDAQKNAYSEYCEANGYTEEMDED